MCAGVEMGQLGLVGAVVGVPRMEKTKSTGAFALQVMRRRRGEETGMAQGGLHGQVLPQG